MKHTEWKCDNCCGAKAVGDARPGGWYLLQGVASTLYVFCSDRCLTEWGWKAQEHLPMGTPVAVVGHQLDPATHA